MKEFKNPEIVVIAFETENITVLDASTAFGIEEI